MARNESTLDAILLRVVARLIDQIADANASTCYLSLDPDTLPSPNPGEIVYVVTPASSGQFDESSLDGGGNALCVIQWPLVITIHNTAINDEVGHDAQFLTNSTRGVVGKTTGVLKALVAHDLQDASSNEILAEPLIPSDAAVERVPATKRGSIQLGFSMLIDWDLS